MSAGILIRLGGTVGVLTWDSYANAIYPECVMQIRTLKPLPDKLVSNFDNCHVGWWIEMKGRGGMLALTCHFFWPPVGLSLGSFSTRLGRFPRSGRIQMRRFPRSGRISRERFAPAQECKKCSVLPYSNTVGGTAGGTVAEYGWGSREIHVRIFFWNSREILVVVFSSWRS